MPWRSSRTANISAAPWSGLLLTLQARLLPLTLLFFLTACAGLEPADVSVNWNRHRQAVQALESWTLQGRLNIRNDNASDTVNINWRQTRDEFVISLSGTLGLGAAQIRGDDAGVVIVRAGADPVRADSLAQLGGAYLGYEFPADQLYYWIRGIPAPGGEPALNLNPSRLLATLSQADATGRRWELQYDRYAAVDGHALPGRIRLEQPPYRLTFIITDWELPSGADGS